MNAFRKRERPDKHNPPAQHTTSLDENVNGSVPVMLTRSYGSRTATTASVTSTSWSTKDMLMNRRALEMGSEETMSSHKTFPDTNVESNERLSKSGIL